jgi:stringent starvation protein B
MKMTDQQPHMITMFKAWFEENGLRTFLSVEADMIASTSPLNDIQQDGTIILSVGFQACPDFTIQDKVISLTLNFNERPNKLVFPLHACRAIFTPEEGIGCGIYDTLTPQKKVEDTFFEELIAITPDEFLTKKPPRKTGPPQLHIVR